MKTYYNNREIEIVEYKSYLVLGKKPFVRKECWFKYVDGQDGKHFAKYSEIEIR